MTNKSIYLKLVEFNYEVNLDFAIKALQEEAIECKSEQSRGKFTLLVKDKDHNKALVVVKNLRLDDKLVSEESDGYTKGFIEWTNNQYIPGYYTGGLIPHYLKDKSNWKYYGLFFICSGIFLLYVTISSLINPAASNSYDFLPVLIALIYTYVGIILTKKARWK